MNKPEPATLLISILGRDKVGLVSAVTGCLFEMGADLADTAFAVLGEGFEFSCVADFPPGVSGEDVNEALKELDLLEGTQITVSRFPFQTMRNETGDITHIVEVTGGDRPGLVARLSEVLVQYEANIVRMNSRRLVNQDGYDYRTRFAVNIPDSRREALESALYNTAGSLRVEAVITPV